MRTDTELLGAYATARDESAFAEIVARHGPMVYRVVLRVLGNPHDSEEAAQATFLVLLRKAGSPAVGANLAAWLHGVARNVARQLAEARRRRARGEEEAAMVREARDEGRGAGGEADRAEVAALLDRELAGLSSGQRQAVILRYLEGRSQDEAAHMAGCPVGTLSRRASDGLERLRTRLCGRGHVLSPAALVGLLGAEATAALPATLLPSILAVSKLAAAGAAAGLSAVAIGAKAEMVGSTAVSLAEGVLKAMFWMKVKLAAAVLAGVAVVGGGGAAAILAAAEPARPEPAPVPRADAGPTKLSQLAASMKPGSWAKLETEGLTKKLTHVTPRDLSIFGWSDDAAWDPVSGQFLFMGFRLELKFIAYSEKTNAWREVPTFKWPLKSNFGHPYGNNAIDAARGIFFHRLAGQGLVENSGKLIYAFDTRKEEWKQLPPCPFKSNGPGWAIEFFPEMNAILFAHEGRIHKLDMATEKWSEMLKGVPFSLHPMLRYNPVHRCVLVAGGNDMGSKVSKIGADGALVRLKDAPFGLNLNHTKLLAEPATGDFVVLTGKDFSAYDIAKDQWTKIEDPDMQPPSRDNSLVVAPIEKHGVSMWVEGKRYQGGRTWLFKYRRPEAAAKAEAG